LLEIELAEALKSISSLSVSYDAAIKIIAYLDKENKGIKSVHNTLSFLKKKISIFRMA